MGDALEAGSQTLPEEDASWHAHWSSQGMTWRREPEIDPERQRYLAERRAISSDVERGIYPFRDAHGRIRLTRADVEWLLATHQSEGEPGPVYWSDERKRMRPGLDLRGVDLAGVNLTYLPLARTRFGLDFADWRAAGPEQRSAAAADLKGADLREARLERASLRGADLEGARLVEAHVAHANFDGARLCRANFRNTHLEETFLNQANLAGADLRRAFFDASTALDGTVFNDATDGPALLADVRWRDANLAVVVWGHMRSLGDEALAHARRDTDGRPKDTATRTAEYEAAVRAYRQLAMACRGLGINELADRYAYRAPQVQRTVLRRKRKFLAWAWSWFLELLAGYGYQPIRTLGLYVGVIMAFTTQYQRLASAAHLHLSLVAALVMSIASFHGRGFFPAPALPLDSPLAVWGAVEAVVGLVIEASFIATFTQRFFVR